MIPGAVISQIQAVGAGIAVLMNLGEFRRQLERCALFDGAGFFGDLVPIAAVQWFAWNAEDDRQKVEEFLAKLPRGAWLGPAVHCGNGHYFAFIYDRRPPRVCSGARGAGRRRARRHRERLLKLARFVKADGRVDLEPFLRCIRGLTPPGGSA